jgi:N-acetylmuramoyl-L-alanine amidase
VARWPGAVWQPVAQCSGTLRPIAVCLHHQAGNGNPAGVYASRDVSAHFWLPRTPGVLPVQHVDTAVRSWHGGGTLNDTSIGVETEGCGTPPNADPLTEYQLDRFGALMAWAHDVHGIPLVKSETATTPGLNYHRCQGGFNTACPCDVRLNQRDEILRRAGGAGPSTPTTKRKGKNMIASTDTGDGYWTVTTDGAVGAFGDAAYCGGAFDFDESQPGRQPMAPGTEIVGIAGKGKDGYWLYASDGGVFTFGSAQFYGRPDRA